MSFDLFLIPFTDQNLSTIPRSAIVAAFGDDVHWEDERSGWTHYVLPKDGCHLRLSAIDSDPNRISCVSVNRPMADDRFMAGLYKIMQSGKVALFFPGGKPLIADLAVAEHLPEFKSLGKPVVVSSGSDIAEQIRSS
jgi:hypothetical protein